MAESTRSKASSDRLEDAIAKLTTHHISLTKTVHTMTLKLDELIHKLAQPETSSPSPSSSNTTPPMATSTPHRLKLDAPRFDGTETLGWIFKINKFFEYHATPEHDRLTITSFYMEGRALAWFQWMTNNGQFTSWPSFL